MQGKGSLINKLIVLVFVALIFAPGVLILSGRQNNQWFDGGRLADRPSLRLDSGFAKLPQQEKIISVYKTTNRFIKKYQEYFASTFPLRDTLLDSFTEFHAKVLGVNPLPNKIVKGDDGWYFLGDTGGDEIEQSKGLRNFSPAQIQKIADTLYFQSEWLKKQNIPFYLVVAPNKVSIYGNALPIKASTKPTELTQLTSAAAGKFNCINTIDGILRKGPRTYNKTDTHWNDVGAFYGYQKFISKIHDDFPETRILKRSEFRFDSTEVMQMDLTRQLGIYEKEIVYNLIPKDTLIARPVSKELQVPAYTTVHPNDYEMRFKSNANDLKVLVFRDSFGRNLVQYIAGSFGESVFIWNHRFDKALIEREKPDIVMYIIVERNIHRLQYITR